ncbi:MAG: GTP 3',8-cyclase MoaA [Phascolarctobacterium sp.]|nr:GTP 3',8-cyclase MoaA [Phascolarctobacterium sp.]
MQDKFGRTITYLRLSVTDLCNLRCKYCMPEAGVCKKNHEDMLKEDEMILAIEAAASLGIRKLRITGGEPLVKKNILSICKRASRVAGIDEVCVTTNGVLLEKYAQELKDAGVKRLNISLDTLDAGKFFEITRGGDLKQVLAGIDAALQAGFAKIKLNAVLMAGFNDDEIRSLAELSINKSIDVRFIELMPMLDTNFDQVAYMPISKVLDVLPELSELSVDGIANLYKLPGAQGNIGLISPVSNNFCAGCNRIRLTADGKFKPCLHAPEEFSIKGLDFLGMVEQMKKAILAKPERHDDLTGKNISKAERSMNAIGG